MCILFILNSSTIKVIYFVTIFFCIIIFKPVKNHVRFHMHDTKKIYGRYRKSTTGNSITHKICTSVDNTIKGILLTLVARHQSCFLRPDTGPCRADILQWYFDPRQHRCYRFYWGGCQGNGNRFETKQECRDFCYLNASSVRTEIPHFCSLTFEYGDCFGYFHRWGWDKIMKTCKRYMYSGCGGNQNNFQTVIECMKTCISPPNNTLHRSISRFTTCMPVFIPDLQ